MKDWETEVSSETRKFKIPKVGESGSLPGQGWPGYKWLKREIQSERTWVLATGDMFLCILPPKGRGNSDDLLRTVFPAFSFLAFPFFPFRKIYPHSPTFVLIWWLNSILALFCTQPWVRYKSPLKLVKMGSDFFSKVNSTY